MSETREKEIIEGTVEDIRFRNEQNGYTVLSVGCDDDLITAALEDPPRKRYNLIIKWLSAFACLALVMIIRSVFCNSEEYKCRE